MSSIELETEKQSKPQSRHRIRSTLCCVFVHISCHPIKPIHWFFSVTSRKPAGRTKPGRCWYESWTKSGAKSLFVSSSQSFDRMLFYQCITLLVTISFVRENWFWSTTASAEIVRFRRNFYFRWFLRYMIGRNKIQVAIYEKSYFPKFGLCLEYFI